jgi:DHA2 family multidrug resistance protein-like MFS transporter
MSPSSAPPSRSALTPGRRWAALAVLTMAVLLLAIDATVLYLAVPSLTSDLAATATEVLWIGDIYSLALAGLLLTMGSLADRIGRKRLLLIGSAGFGAASLLAAFSSSAAMLIVARLLLGVAGATLMPSTLSIIRNIFTDPGERTRAIAVWSAAAGGGAALGPVVGGALLENFAWGSVFLINVPIMAVLIVAGWFLLPESKDPNPGRLDLASVALSMAAIVPLVYAVKHAATAGVDVVSAIALVVGLAMGTLFVRRQRKLDVPLIDVELFRRPAFSGAVIANFVAVFALTGLLFFFSQYLQLVRGLAPLQAGLTELPATIAAIAIIALVGVILRRLGAGRAIAFGLLLSTAGLVALALAEGAGSVVWLMLALVPIGLGVGLAETVTVDAVVSAVPAHKAGAASAIAETAYELGTALGIAVLGSVVAMLYRSGLALPADLPADTADTARDSLAGAASVLPQGTPVWESAAQAFTHAMQTTSIIASIITLAAGILAWRTIPSTIHVRAHG